MKQSPQVIFREALNKKQIPGAVVPEMHKVQIQIKTAYLWPTFQLELEENCDLWLEPYDKNSFAISF